MCKLDLMDEAYYVLNSDAYGRLKYKKVMQQFMEEVEKMLPMLQEHPIINEIALRMGFYAYRMDDYERCKKYYEEYRRTRLLVSIEQYTPWMHVYLMVVSFVVRVLYILDTIRKLPSTNEVIREKASVRQNIQSFLIEPSEREYVILGRLLGFNNLVLLKRFMCKDEASGNEKAHVWFIFPDFEWEIDIAYNNITEDDETDRIFFVSGQHPMENGLSRFFSKKSAQESLGIPMVQTGTFGLGNFSDEEQEEMLEICDMLEKHLPKACPTMEELVWAYGDVMVPVGAGSEDDEK